MQMDAGMDTGPILLQKGLKIEPDDTYPTLSQKLVKTAILALTEALEGYVLKNSIVPQAQDSAQATYTKILTREDGKIDWSKSAQEIYNQYRALTPWPGIWTVLGEKRVKLLKIKPVTSHPSLITKHGTWNMKHEHIFVSCGKDSIEVLELQIEGSKPMDAKQFINGYKNLIVNNKVISN